MFCLFYLRFLHLCTRLTNPSNCGCLTVSHLTLSSLDPFRLSKHSCAPHWAKIRNMEGKQRERLVWKIPSAFTHFHRTSGSVEAAWSTEFGIPGLIDVVGGK